MSFGWAALLYVSVDEPSKGVVQLRYAGRAAALQLSFPPARCAALLPLCVWLAAADLRATGSCSIAERSVRYYLLCAAAMPEERDRLGRLWPAADNPVPIRCLMTVCSTVLGTLAGYSSIAMRRRVCDALCIALGRNE